MPTADIGGNLGLCLGASLFSVVEFGEFIVIAIASMCSRMKNAGKMKRKVSTVEDGKEGQTNMTTVG